MITKQRVLKLLLTVALVISLAAGMYPPDKAAASPPLQDEEIGSFESDSEQWTLNTGGEFPGATGEFARDSADAKSGEYAGKLRGNFSNGGEYVAIGRTMAQLDMRELVLWVKTGDLHTVRLRATDATGQVHQQKLPLQASPDWQQLTVSKFDGGVSYEHFGGANDGVWHAPAKEVSFILARTDLSDGKTEGEFLIDDITAKVPVPDLSFEQTRLGNIFTNEEPVTFDIETAGDAVSWTVFDTWSNKISEGRQTIAGGAGNLSIPSMENGYYRLELTAEQNGTALKKAETSFAVLSPFDFGQVEDSPFGVATHFGQWWNPEVIPLIEKAGAKSIRDELYWNNVEKEKGVFAYPQPYDSYMAELQEHSVKPFIIFSYANPNYDEGSTPYTDEGRQAFARYGRELLQHYGEQMEWVEVYNEFNIGFGDAGNGPADSKPEYYYKLLKETYETVKAHDPGVTVVGPTTAGVPMDWLEELFNLGALEYMDAVSIHPYRYPNTPEGLTDDLVKVQDLIKKYNNGQPKPIWITEIGWPTQKDNRGVSENVQAETVVRSHVLALSQGVEKFYWYDFMNDGTDEQYNENNFGLIRHPTDAKGRYVPKPAYVAYAAMTRQLTGAEFKRQEEIGADIYSFLFDKSGDDVRVIWATDRKHVTIKTSTPIIVTDMVGHAKVYHPDKSDVVYLSIDGDPLYVSGSIQHIEEGGKYTLQSGAAFLNEDIPLTLTVDNSIAPKAPIDAYFEIAGETYPVSARPEEKVEIAVSVPGLGTAGVKQLTGDIVIDGKAAARLSVDVQVKPQIGMQVKHVLRDGEDTLRITVRNSSSRDYTAESIDWTIGERSGTENLNVTVPGTSEQAIELPLSELAASQTYPVSLSLHVTGYPLVTYSGKVVMVDAGNYVALEQKSIAVDGSLDDLSAIPSMNLTEDGTVQMQNYTGEADLSGDVWATWDEDYFYLSAKIRDDVFSQTATGDQIWNGDSIQFAVSPGTPGESSGWYEYGIALTTDGPQVYRWSTAGQPVGPVQNASLQVTTNEASHETTYELALPWSELAPIVPEDQLLSFSFLVNDNDGQGRKGWIEWGSGIGGSKDSNLFKPFRFSSVSQ